MKKFQHDRGVLYHGDCLELMTRMRRRKQSVDLICGSPPYEAQRKYDEIDFKLQGQEWVDWMVEVVQASLKVCHGMVVYVVGHGVQENYQWSATPALLLADLHRAGVCLRNPKWFHRVGISGSSGPDDFRKDVEFIVCATAKRGRLPWSDNTACGQPWKYQPGGPRSHRAQDGRRVVEHCFQQNGKGDAVTKKVRRTLKDIANPGDLISGSVGGGRMGSNIAHETDAPYPEWLPGRFIRSWCPSGGVVFDPFVGSGTTVAVALKYGRRFIGCDLRRSQIRLTERRIRQVEATGGLFHE
jgi:hypothetical protein